MGTLPIPLSEENAHCVNGCVFGAVLFWRFPYRLGFM